MSLASLAGPATSANFHRSRTTEITHNIETPWTGTVDDWDSIEAQHDGSWVVLFIVTPDAIEAAERVLAAGSYESKVVRLRRNGMGGGL